MSTSAPTAADTVTYACPRCGGTGEHAFHLVHGRRCFGCWGSGTVTVTRAQYEARERRAAAAREREAARQGEYDTNAALSAEVHAVLEDAWPDLFADIPEEYRFMHRVQKAQWIARHILGLRLDTFTGALMPHLDAIFEAQGE